MSLLDFLNFMENKKRERRENQFLKKLQSVYAKKVGIEKSLHSAENRFNNYFKNVHPELYSALSKFVNEIQLEYCKTKLENERIKAKYTKDKNTTLGATAKFNIIDELVEKSLSANGENIQAENRLFEFLKEQSSPELDAYHRNSQYIHALYPRLQLYNYNPELDDAFFEAELRAEKVLSLQNAYNSKVEEFNNLLATYHSLFPNSNGKANAYIQLSKYQSDIVYGEYYKVLQRILKPSIVEKEAKRIIDEKYAENNLTK